MTRQLLITMRDEDAANEALSLIRKSDEEIKKQFHMLGAINSVIKLLEMDGSFTDMAQKGTGECSYYHKAYRCFYHPQKAWTACIWM